jgi:hypothetical protein
MVASDTTSDLLLEDGNAPVDICVLCRQGKHLALIVQGGRVVKDKATGGRALSLATRRLPGST